MYFLNFGYTPSPSFLIMKAGGTVEGGPATLRVIHFSTYIADICKNKTHFI